MPVSAARPSNVAGAARPQTGDHRVEAEELYPSTSALLPTRSVPVLLGAISLAARLVGDGEPFLDQDKGEVALYAIKEPSVRP